MYYYKSRMYSPTLGRFMQTDPIGYADGMNWYNYAGADPVNSTDPSGLAPPPIRTGNACQRAPNGTDQNCFVSNPPSNSSGQGPDITVMARPLLPSLGSLPIVGSGSNNGGNEAGGSATPQNRDIVVTAKKKKQPALNFVGNRAGGPDDDEDPDDYDDYQRDLDVCRGLKGAAAANCYNAAERRRFARNNGKPLPPLARAGAGAAASLAAGAIIYWIISEGSRVLFPLRNLIPVP